MIDVEIKGLGCRFDDHMVFGVNGTLIWKGGLGKVEVSNTLDLGTQAS